MAHPLDPDRPAPPDANAQEEPAIDAGSIRILPSRYEVFIDAQRVELTLTQFRILSIMARRPGWVFTPEQIARGLEREGSEGEASAMRNHIYMMRRKLGRAGGKQLETVRGVGNRVTPSATDSDATQTRSSHPNTPTTKSPDPGPE